MKVVPYIVSPEDGLFEWFAAEVLANAKALRGGADVGVTIVTLTEVGVGERNAEGPGCRESALGTAPASASVTCFSCGQTIDNEGEET